MWTIVAPARAAAMPDSAICSGVTGTCSERPTVSPAPVRAQVIMTLRFNGRSPSSMAGQRPFQTGLPLLGERLEPLEAVLGAVERRHRRERAARDQVQGLLEPQRLRRPGGLLDRGEDQRRAGGEQPRGLPGAGPDRLLVGQHLVDHAPARRLRGGHPASGQEQLHRDVVGHPLGQLDRRRVREGARVDLRQPELGGLRGVDQVARQGQLEAAAHRQAVHGRDHRLVEVGQLLEPAEAADAVVAVDRVAVGGGLEVPAGAEELVALGAHDRHPQVGVVAEAREDLAHLPAGGQVDGVGLAAGRG